MLDADNTGGNGYTRDRIDSFVRSVWRVARAGAIVAVVLIAAQFHINHKLNAATQANTENATVAKALSARILATRAETIVRGCEETNRRGREARRVLAATGALSATGKRVALTLTNVLAPQHIDCEQVARDILTPHQP